MGSEAKCVGRSQGKYLHVEHLSGSPPQALLRPDIAGIGAVSLGLCTEAELDELQAHIGAWLTSETETNEMVASLESDVAGPRTWYVRLLGETKDAIAIEFSLGQRTLAYETYLMPSPEENHADFYQHLLVRNRKQYGASFVIGQEDGIYLQGQLDNRLIRTDGELDRVLGSIWSYVEQCFQPALRIGFASRFS